MRLTLILLAMLASTMATSQVKNLLKNRLSSLNLKDKGKELLSNSLQKTREKFDTTSFNYSVSFSDHAAQFEDKEKFDDVKSASSIYLDKEKDKTPLQEAREHVDLGEMYYASNGFRLAEISFIAALAILELDNQQESSLYPRVLADMGMLYNGMGRYELAKLFTVKSLETRAATRGKNSIDYAASLNNMAVLDKNIGNYNEAERAFSETLKINIEVSGRNSMAYAITLNNRGVLYQNLGRYGEAEKDLKESLAVVAENMNTKSAKFTKFQTNLGLLYQQQQKYVQADEIFTEAINSISRNPLKSKKINPDYAHLVETKANLYLEMGKVDEAESLFKEALAVYENKFGKRFSGYGLTKARLGALYRTAGKLDLAQTYLGEAETLLASTYGKQHPNYTEVSTELALLNWQKGNLSTANSLFTNALNQSLEFVQRYFAPMSDVEKAAYWKTLRPRFDKYFAFLADAGNDEAIMTSAINYRLATKAILLSSTTRVKNQILGSGDVALIADYKSWIDNKHQLAHYYSMSQEDLRKQQVNLDSLQDVTNKLEKDLSEKSGIFDDAFASNTPVLSDVQNSLSEDEAAVEIVHAGFSLDNSGGKYLAFIITKNSIRQVVLKNGEELDTKYFKFYRNAITYKRADNFSYSQFWEPIDAAIPTSRNIYLSSDGVYNQININSLKDPNGQYILEKLHILNVSSLRAIVDEHKADRKQKFALLVGNPEYGSDDIDPLPGTGKEIRSISSILKTGGIQSQIHENSMASEQVIKEVQNAGIIHIATHGFFVKNESPTGHNVFSVPLHNVNENVLLRSGLLLANAGSSKHTLAMNSDNGVLTAYEVMNMELSQTDLVVLSACETGLGDILAGEGVYGLQRAFEVAGAKSVIMSLWKVNDEATQLLMTKFYENWIKTGDRLGAFADAQKSLKKTHPEPYFWGAFVMLGK